MRKLLAAISLVLLALLFMLYAAPLLQRAALALYPVEMRMEKETAPEDIKEADEEIAAAEKKIASFVPRQPYLVINTHRNRFYLHSGGKVVREGLCSTGSYTLLEGGKDQKWLFSTPKGVRKIQGKITSPVWRKPDWAFVEEGLPVPAKNSSERYEYGVLGDYALSLGHGYLIHGTLYQRLLGMPVTHGCVRVGDDDLEQIYKTLSSGNKVFIY